LTETGVNAGISSLTAAFALEGFVSISGLVLLVFGSSHTSLQTQGPQTLIKQFFKLSAIKAQIITRIEPKLTKRLPKERQSVSILSPKKQALVIMRKKQFPQKIILKQQAIFLE
jgi:hypothetical protein